MGQWLSRGSPLGKMPMCEKKEPGTCRSRRASLAPISRPSGPRGLAERPSSAAEASMKNARSSMFMCTWCFMRTREPPVNWCPSTRPARSKAVMSATWGGCQIALTQPRCGVGAWAAAGQATLTTLPGQSQPGRVRRPPIVDLALEIEREVDEVAVAARQGLREAALGVLVHVAHIPLAVLLHDVVGHVVRGALRARDEIEHVAPARRGGRGPLVAQKRLLGHQVDVVHVQRRVAQRLAGARVDAGQCAPT
eukprot:scaffold24159_cov68-Phaeocystis_antarctica.AAC.8